MPGEGYINNGENTKFSQRAHQYICAYYKIVHEQEMQEMEEAQIATYLDASPIKVEKIVKLFKTYHCTMDFDANFCKLYSLNKKNR
jgi:hypothetical protein